jgi:chromosomal replication initiator protein
VAEFIADSITTNVRQLEGAVKKMSAYRDLMKIPPDMDSARSAISELVRESPGLAPTPQLILQEVCSYFNLNPQMLLGNNRRADLVNARQIIMYLCRLLTDKSLHDIGKFIKRDHTTVGHGVEQVEFRKQTDLQLSKDIQTLYENIKSK